MSPVGTAPQPGLADLHRHLDGSLRLETVTELAEEEGVQVPAKLTFFAGMGLTEALSRFAFTLRLLQRPGAIRLVADEICQDAQADGVSTLELRFAPQLHGLPLPVAVDAALEGLDGRAGLLLCGLYGEAPELLESLVDLAATRPGVVGLDLAGGPIPDHRFGMRDYVRPFLRARELGMGTTVHAGEGRPPAEIQVAIDELRVARIGHGTTLLDDPAVLERVLQQEVTIEACITSNLHVGAISALEDHPLPTWLRKGVQACVCTDNTLLSDVTASGEHRLAASLPGMNTRLLDQAIRWGHEAAFTR